MHFSLVMEIRSFQLNLTRAALVAQMAKNPHAMADDLGSTPKEDPGEGNKSTPVFLIEKL